MDLTFVTCHNCNAEILSDSIYCHKCGRSIRGETVCPKCGLRQSISNNKCTECDTSLLLYKHKKIQSTKYEKGTINYSNNQQKSLILIISIAAILMFFGVGFLVYFLSAKDESLDIKHNVENTESFIPPQDIMDYNVLIEEYLTDLEENPDDIHIMIDLANTYFDKGDFNLAINWYNKILEKDMNNINVMVDLGVSYYNSHQDDKAIETFKKILQIESEHQTAYYNLGIISASQGDNEQAKTYWKKCIEIDPDESIARTAMRQLGKLK